MRSRARRKRSSAATSGAVSRRAARETISALLRIAQVEGASPRAGFRDVDLTAITEAVCDAYRLDAEEAGHQMTATIAQGITVSGDQELLTQALSNLVE